METVRTIIDSERLLPIIELPESLRHRKVEVIIFAHDEFVCPEKFFPPENGIKGILKEYANSTLVEQEKDAWGNALMEKYGNES